MRPAASSPSNTGSASWKSPVDSPCKYKSGNTASTFGDRRTYGGRIRLVKRCRLPSTTRLSFTRGVRSSIVPAPTVTDRGRPVPFRTTIAWSSLSRSCACRTTYSSASILRAAAIIRRAPSRARSSSVNWIPSLTSSRCFSFRPLPPSSTLSIGVPFPDDEPPSSPSAFPGFVHPERYAAFSDLRDPQLLAISHNPAAASPLQQRGPGLPLNTATPLRPAAG